jgi:Rps23 Pro-64 3,4-dihydroxylase Tpa1-like proline 4-hydroxylase
MTVKQTTHLIGNNSITIIDGLFSWAEMEGLYVNIATLPFRICNSNKLDIQSMQDKKLKADIDTDFLTSINFFDSNRESILQQLFEDGNYDLTKAYINCGIKGDSHECHVDAYYKDQGKTLLYYANRDWNPNFGGETIFYNEDRTEIEFVSTYKPGRVVVFDSEIPHSARPQSLDGPNYRFTLALKYLKN